MFEMAQLLAGTNLFLLAFSVLIFDIPRFTLSLVSLALFGLRRQSNGVPAGNRFGQRDHTGFQRRLRARSLDHVAASTNLTAGRNHCRR